MIFVKNLGSTGALSATVASWLPIGATLAEGRSGTLPCNPALRSLQGATILVTLPPEMSHMDIFCDCEIFCSIVHSIDFSLKLIEK